MAFRSTRTGAATRLIAIGLLIGAGMVAGPASAGLGRAYMSVEADRAHFGAGLQSASAGLFTMHVLTLANGGVVKEFTRTDGTVFAVAWRAPGRPDLRQLLAGYFDTVQTDNPPRVGRRLRIPISVNRPDLLVRTGGHPGAFWGTALLPQIQPAGFSFSDAQ